MGIEKKKILRGSVRELLREWECERDRQTYILTDRQIDKEGEIKRERQTDRQRNRVLERGGVCHCVLPYEK